MDRARRKDRAQGGQGLQDGRNGRKVHSSPEKLTCLVKETDSLNCEGEERRGNVHLLPTSFPPLLPSLRYLCPYAGERKKKAFARSSTVITSSYTRSHLPFHSLTLHSSAQPTPFMPHPFIKPCTHSSHTHPCGGRCPHRGSRCEWSRPPSPSSAASARPRRHGQDSPPTTA